jgi:hypothetical protein
MEKAMKLASIPRILASDRGGRVSALVLALTLTVSGVGSARAEGDDATKILKTMSDYMAKQKSINVNYDTDVEVITSELQKIQFVSSGHLLMIRPDKLQVSRVGGYSDVELVFDGKTTTVFDHDHNAYTEISSAGTVEQLVERMRDEFQLPVPGADLLLASSFDRLMDGVIDAKHIGLGVVDGVECEHLAFRNVDTDWQLWVEVGSHPVPHKYVITNKGVSGAPQYTLHITSMVTDGPIAADAFVFKAPAGAKKAEMKDLHDLDEVPSGVVAGESK